MPAYILTGTPGAGKTAVLRSMEIRGHPVVEEAATDVIALASALGRPEPWHRADFIDSIIALQQRRQAAVRAAPGATVFSDRSPICTLALCRFLGFAESPVLTAAVDQVIRDKAYEPAVFLIRNQGFVRNTPARRISFADSVIFERFHEDVYREKGFELVEVPPGPLDDRVALIERVVSRRARRITA